MKIEKLKVDDRTNIERFRKEKGDFTIDDYIKIFLSLISNEKFSFKFIYYEHEEDELTARDFIYDINRINNLKRDGASVIQGFFESNDEEYELTYEDYDSDKIDLIFNKKKQAIR